MPLDQVLLSSVSAKFKAGKFDKFIHTVCFPKFKNFAPLATIDFRFPISILVGPNGGGKTSVLHAAWGMPLKYSTSRFWFSTPVDPIQLVQGEQNRYWYTHYIKAIDQKVQSRKITGNKSHGYWEPTRPAQKDGMDAMPPKSDRTAPYTSQTGDRWTPVDRTPHYFNAKTDSSAFDRFFNSVDDSTLEERQDYFVRYSGKLKEVIDSNLNSYTYYGIQKVDKNFMLSSAQLNAVNSILQKKYKSARYVTHKFYDRLRFSPSVIFETGNLNYSECFAGSGELAVVNFVLATDALKDFDLLLLDEPETSLHPGAQIKLLEYILKIVDTKFIQVIVSTHSDTFVKSLPPEALIVLDESTEGFQVRANPRRSTAFHRLGSQDNNAVVILAEDKLLQKFVERAVQRLPKEDKKRIRVEASDLGVTEMLSNQLRAHIQADAKALLVVDGDQKPVEDIFTQDINQLSNVQKLAALDQLKKLNISIVGGPERFDSWMEGCRKRVLLLDDLCPEKVFLSLISPTHPLLADKQATNTKFKDALRKVLLDKGNDVESPAAAATFKHVLGGVGNGTEVDILLDKMKQKIADALHQFE